jgi:hypothetical protein
MYFYKCKYNSWKERALMLKTKDLKSKRQPLTSDCKRREVCCVVKRLYCNGLQL